MRDTRDILRDLERINHDFSIEDISSSDRKRIEESVRIIFNAGLFYPVPETVSREEKYKIESQITSLRKNVKMAILELRSLECLLSHTCGDDRKLGRDLDEIKSFVKSQGFTTANTIADYLNKDLTTIKCSEDDCYSSYATEQPLKFKNKHVFKCSWPLCGKEQHLTDEILNEQLNKEAE